jgi:ubiquitin-protein ligase
MDFSQNYPFKPPVVKFVSQVWHPNIKTDGTVCMAAMEANWKAGNKAVSIVDTFLSILARPNAADPVNTDAATQMASNPAAFEQQARQWTSQYASS